MHDAIHIILDGIVSLVGWCLGLAIKRYIARQDAIIKEQARADKRLTRVEFHLGIEEPIERE